MDISKIDVRERTVSLRNFFRNHLLEEDKTTIATLVDTNNLPITPTWSKKQNGLFIEKLLITQSTTDSSIVIYHDWENKRIVVLKGANEIRAIRDWYLGFTVLNNDFISQSQINLTNVDISIIEKSLQRRINQVDLRFLELASRLSEDEIKEISTLFF